IAKARGSLSRTGGNRIKGKYAYMAPEQLRSEPVDARADIYALGVCIFEAMTGTRPFASDSEEQLLAVRMEGRFKRPSEIVPDFPTELEHVILGAMWPDPEGRPSAKELRDALLAFVAKRGGTDADVSTWINELFPNDSFEVGVAYDPSGKTPTPRPTPVE